MKSKKAITNIEKLAQIIKSCKNSERIIELMEHCIKHPELIQHKSDLSIVETEVA